MSKPPSPPAPTHAQNATRRPPARRDALRPWLLAALVGLYVARVLLPSESAARFGDGLLFVLLSIVLAVVWALRGAMRRDLEGRLGAVDAAFAALLACVAASTWLATRQGAPRPAINMLWEWVGLGLGFFLTRQLVRGPREARAIVVVMLGLGAALSAFGLHQFFVTMPADRALFAEQPDEALRQARVFAPEGSRQRLLFENRVNSTEPMATFELANSLAGVLAAWLVVALAIGCAALAAHRGWQCWLPPLSCAALMLACLLLTKSRAAFLAVAVGSALVLFAATWRGRAVRWFAAAGLLAVAAVVVAAAVFSGALDRQVLSEAGKSLGYRVQYWQASWRMIEDHIWLGSGLGQFQDTYTQYKLPEASETIADPHNFLFEVWATAGTPAAAALLLVLGLAFWQGLRGDAADAAAAVSPDAACQPDATPHVLAGGVAGFLLAYAAGPLATVPLTAGHLLGGLAVAAASWALLTRWLRDGDLTPGIPLLAAAALLVNLLAAGGIGFPAVAGSLWLLLALGVSRAVPARPIAPVSAKLLLAASVALAAGCYQTAYKPVIACGAALYRAEADSNRADVHFREAALADPLAVDPWRGLAALEWLRWQRRPGDKTLALFAEYLDHSLLLEPRSSSAWEFKADALAAVHQQTRQPEHLAESIAAYRRAVDLYPNFAPLRAKLALALAETDDLAAAEVEASAALRLDAATPHDDLKLPADLKTRLKPLVAGPN